MNNNPDISFVYSMSFTFGDVNFFSEYYELFPLPFRTAQSREELIKIGNTIPVSSVLIRKEALELAGGFDESEELKVVEDYDLWLRLSEKVKFHFIPRVHLYYRIHPYQSSSGWEKRAERLQFLANKQNIKLPEYKYYRRKGLSILLIRNSVHLVFYLFYKITGYLENRDRLAV
jgi:GT2 family glycosyltransferase